MTIKKNMSITDVVARHPKTIAVFMRFGMHCFGCAVAQFENIEQGALAHGIDVDKLIVALNEELENDKKGT